MAENGATVTVDTGAATDDAATAQAAAAASVAVVEASSAAASADAANMAADQAIATAAGIAAAASQQAAAQVDSMQEHVAAAYRRAEDAWNRTQVLQQSVTSMAEQLQTLTDGYARLTPQPALQTAVVEVVPETMTDSPDDADGNPAAKIRRKVTRLL